MKVMINVYDLSGRVVEKIQLPNIFSFPVRTDVIQKVFLIVRSNMRQPYGADPMAGKRSSAHYHGRREKRYTMMNRELSRIPRIHGQVGYLMWRARVAPHAVKGRKAHPPKAEKKFTRKMNKNENRIAIISAIAASARPEFLALRGHSSKESPIVLTDEFETLEKTKDVVKVLKHIGLEKELKRTKKKKVRAGKGKMRGRRYRKKKGPLIVVTKPEKIIRAARNIPGVDVSAVDNLNIDLLAPGGQPGRLLIITKSGLIKLEQKFGG